MTEPSPTLDRPRPAAPRSPTGAARIGRALIAAAAVATIVVPVLLDAVILRGAHMGNPAWLPHAKLHAAMSFDAAIALGAAGLVCVLCRPVTDRFAMTMGAVLAAAFEVCLIAAGLWPGTSYYFAGDPVYGRSIDDAQVLGIPDNVGTSLIIIALAAVGLGLVLRRERSQAPIA